MKGRPGRDVRAALLSLLSERPMHGYELMLEVAARTGGMWRPSPGSVYPTLRLLQAEGLAVGHRSAGRNWVRLTEAGRAAARAAVPPPWRLYPQEVLVEARAAGVAVAAMLAAIQQAYAAGSPAQRAALDLLAKAGRQLGTLLDKAG